MSLLFFYVVGIIIGLCFTALMTWDENSSFFSRYPEVKNYIAFWSKWFGTAGSGVDPNEIFMGAYASEMLIGLWIAIIFNLFLILLQLLLNRGGRAALAQFSDSSMSSLKAAGNSFTKGARSASGTIASGARAAGRKMASGANSLKKKVQDMKNKKKIAPEVDDVSWPED